MTSPLRVVSRFTTMHLIMPGMGTYTAVEAATVCQVSTRTIQRKIDQLAQAGAWKDAAGNWHIPIAALASVGLSPGRPAAPDTTLDMSLRQRDSDADILSQLRAEAAEWRRRAEVAETQATERERVIATQAQALKMLDAPPSPPPSAAPARPAASPPAPGSRLARLLRR